MAVSTPAPVSEPTNVYYGTSCLGGGAGGELHYVGFVVFIYKTALEDTVRTVQKR